MKFLWNRGLEGAPTPGSAWTVRYAPDSGSRLTDHLQEQGFELATLVRAGLTRWTDDGAALDHHRDRLMFVSRDHQMTSVGFVGIDRDGQLGQLTPSPIFRPPNAFIGLTEQLDLLKKGATPIIVDHPLDAIAIDVLSRLESKQYAGIPLCESPLSTDQARMLRRSSESNRAIVAVPTEKEGRRRAIGALLELATVFDRVRILHLPPEPGMPIDPQSTVGEKEIREYLACPSQRQVLETASRT